MMTHTVGPTVEPVVTVPSLAWKTLTCVSLVSFMAAIEVTIISLALEDIRSTFPRTTGSQLSWIFNAYTLVAAAFLLPAGWIGDRFGRRATFVAGVALFTLGSLASGLSWSIESLLAARVLQGVGGALQAPSGLALVLTAFPPEKRQLSLGIWGASSGLAAALGPTLGAVLIDLTDWRMLFLINAPIGLVVVIMATRQLVPSPANPSLAGVDLIGVPLASIGIGALLLGILEGEQWGWGSSRTWACFSFAAALVLFFMGRSRRHRQPLFDLQLFRLRSFSVGIVGQTAFIAAFYAWLVPLPTYLRSVWGWSVLKAGFAIAPGPVIAMAAAIGAGRLADRVGTRIPMIVGGLCGTVGVLLQISLVDTLPHYWLGIFTPTVLVGIAAGVSIAGSIGAVMVDVPSQQYAMAGSARQTCVQLAVATGIALAFAIVGTPDQPIAFLRSIRITWLLVAGLYALAAVLFALVYPSRPTSRIDVGALG